MREDSRLVRGLAVGGVQPEGDFDIGKVQDGSDHMHELSYRFCGARVAARIVILWFMLVSVDGSPRSQGDVDIIRRRESWHSKEQEMHVSGGRPELGAK